MGFQVLHGITDCLFVQGEPVDRLKAAIEAASGYLMEVETFDWVVFLPQKDGTGAYTWYYGRLDDGEVKVRGIMARRGDCPAYVQRFQQEALALMGTARSIAGAAGDRPGGRGGLPAVLRRARDGPGRGPGGQPADLDGGLHAEVPGTGRGRVVSAGRRARGAGDDDPVRGPGRSGRPGGLRLGGGSRGPAVLPPRPREGVGRGGRGARAAGWWAACRSGGIPIRPVNSGSGRS